MRPNGESLIGSATDLSNFLSCRHLTALEMAVARGKRQRPHWHDPLLDILFQRGLGHEKAYVDSLMAEGRQIVDLSALKEPSMAVAATLKAMAAGPAVIVQAAFGDGRWYGRPDVLRRVEVPSVLGGWSYEALDTKLARETRSGTILQMSLYSEMLGAAQGVPPEHFYVVIPSPIEPVHTYRVDEYAAYVRLVCQQMQGTIALDDGAVAAENYPEPVDHCDICRWSSECSKKRHRDDHLSLVAGISRLMRRELESREIATLAALAATPVPLPFKPSRGAAESYVRVREQARVQHESRDKATPHFELRLPFAGSVGLCALPEPSPGDVFLDLEGDAFAAEGGREYLFGLVTTGPDGAPAYEGYWAFDDAEEQFAFESVVDLVTQKWQTNPGMHVYHYAPYEPSAFKRLMGRYTTREEELDRLLRAGRFVDLYSVVRQGVLVGVERYSIKSLEPLYDFDRAVRLPDANRALLAMEQALELHCPENVPTEVRDAVVGYNRDDCMSTRHLRDWLEKLRTDALATGASISRPVAEEGESSKNVDERTERVEELRARLLVAVPSAPGDRTDDQHARWLLAYLLDWHRREDKAGWWEYYRLCELPEEDLFDEPQAVTALVRQARLGFVISQKTGKPTRSLVDRYAYPVQEMEIRRGDDLKLQDGKKWAEVTAVDRVARTIDVKKGPTRADEHPTSTFAHSHVATAVLEDALFALGEAAAAQNSGVDGLRGAAQNLLARRPPSLASAAFLPLAGEQAVDFAVRIAGELNETCLAIQGPPGSGKTYTGAQMILALAQQGRKVAVTATSHKVIRNLLDAVCAAADEAGQDVSLAHKQGRADDADEPSGVDVLLTNESALYALESGTANVVGGTAWLWARPEFARAVDVLFVDEAGQMSLANVLAVSRAAESIVLLGDPQQLEQPQKGSHPDGADASALQHILGEHRTIPPERGIFLPVTWRLGPRVCSFTSELFYEGRLSSKPGLEYQHLSGAGQFDGSGLWVVEVKHEGNRNSSPEEVDAVADLVTGLTTSGVRWVNEHGEEAQMTGNRILVVSSYNAQVSRLAERLEPLGVRVGTVDKFQGQEAPVVIYSMATSSPEDAPRGMEFLYSLNRLNVATSRARCAAILVASPRLFEPECRTPRQMKLANALCRYRELARVLSSTAS